MEQLKVEMLRRKYSNLLERPEIYPSDANWDFIITHRLATGLSHKLYRKFLVSALMPEAEVTGWHKIALKRFPEYIKVIDRTAAVDTVYSDVTSCPDATSKLIRDCSLFDAGKIVALLDEANVETLSFIMEILDSWQPEYSGRDLKEMTELAEMLNDLPPLGEISQQSGWFGKDRRYVCPSGHLNKPDVEFCEHEDCGLNIFGLKKEHIKAVEEFSTRCKVLKELLDLKQ